MKDLKIAANKALLFCFLLLSGTVSNAQTAPFDKFFTQASSLVAKEDYEAALFQLKQVTDKDPNNLEALDFASFIYARLKNYKEAISRSIQLTKLQRYNANYFTNAGWYLMLNKEYEEAEKYCLHALSLNDCSYAVYLMLGHVYGFLTQFNKCEEYYKKAASYIPNKEEYERIFQQFELLTREGNFPHDIEPYKNMFVNFFKNEYSVKEYANGILDSIYYLTSYENPTAEVLNDLKERFLKEELKNKSYRLYVMRDFFWSLGWIHYNNGSRLQSMQNYFINVIKISNQLKDTSFIIDVLHSVGDANSRGLDNSDDEGIALIKQALDLAIVSNNFIKQFHISILLGDKMEQKKKPDDALMYYRQSFILANKLGQPTEKNYAINRLMNWFGNMNQFDSVDHYYALLKSLQNDNMQVGLSNDLNYCFFLNKAGKYARTVSTGRHVINEYKDQKQLDISGMYARLGAAYAGLLKTDSAIFFHKEAIRLYNAFIKNNSDVEHELPFKQGMESFRYLKKMALERNDIYELFDLSEQTKTNILYPVTTGHYYAPESIAANKVAKDLKSNEVAISFSNSYKTKEGYAIALSNDATLLVKEDHILLESLIKKHVEVNWDEVFQTSGPAFALARQGENPEEGRTSMLAISVIANNLNNMMSGRFTRSSITKENSKRKNIKAEMLALNDILYAVYFKPFEKFLTGKNTIYLSADLGTTLIPFEVLQNEKGEYLGELYNIIYVGSFTTRAVLKDRVRQGKKRMLALGNPMYSTFNPNNTEGRAYDLAQAGLDKWADLPGTKEELVAIRKNVPSVTIIDQPDLTESKVKLLSTGGQLAEYDILHFAVHGMASKMDYRDHTLIVSEPLHSANDGFLQFDEIANLKISASLVCLSACETALTIPGEGEEVKNLPVAFFLAGAQSVIATWWRIDDAATALFMSSFYTLVFKENKTYSSALHLTRQKFIRGEFGEKYKAPYYWGAFKYFGY